MHLARLAPVILTAMTMTAFAQNAPDRQRGGPPREGRGPGGSGSTPERELVEQFDKDGNERLDNEERKAARAFLAEDKANAGDRGGRRRGGGGGRGRRGRTPSEPASTGPKVALDEVEPIADADFYDVKSLRTLFFEFENGDWESELIDFDNTDVEVPAKLTVDGKAYEGVGVRVRGQSSSRVGLGYQRPLNVSIDFTDEDLRLDGYKTLNLHNANGDPSMIRAILYLIIAREYLPAAKANLVRVVINGEYWGVYQNSQQVNKEFIDEWYDTRKGARWKAPGSPRGQASLAYLGDDPEAYKEIYEIKSKDKEKSWKALINLCKILTETPANELPAALEPIFDVEGALKFLALENALINSDGYWTRTSDYYLYQDTKDKFHIIPHDVNETFTQPHSGGPGGRERGNRRGRGGEGPSRGERPEGNGERPPRGERPEGDGERPPRGERLEGERPQRGQRGPQVNGVELDPLVAAKDESKLLLYKLLAVKKWREQYLGHVQEIADTWLDWGKLGPIAKDLHTLIADDVKTGTRKLASYQDFVSSITESEPGENETDSAEGRGGRSISLRKFAEERREYLLNYKSTWKD